VSQRGVNFTRCGREKKEEMDDVVARFVARVVKSLHVLTFHRYVMVADAELVLRRESWSSELRAGGRRLPEQGMGKKQKVKPNISLGVCGAPSTYRSVPSVSVAVLLRNSFQLLSQFVSAVKFRSK
jgi:hypothetical protein